MEQKSRKHRESFEVLFYHLDRNGYGTLQTAMNFMQATANMHGRTMGTSLEDLSEESYTWVFSRFHIEMVHYPVHYDRIWVDTWRSTSKKCFAFREFQMFNDAGTLIGAASASAVLMDKLSRKPVDIPDYIQKQFAPEEGRGLDVDFKPIQGPETEDYVKLFSVRLSDIDMNQHVNNTSYVDWIIESLPESVLMNKRLLSCEIGYKEEAFYGDTIRSCSGLDAVQPAVSQNKESYLHRLVRERDQKTTTLARTVWANE